MHLSAPSMVATLLFLFLSRCMLGFKFGCGEDWLNLNQQGCVFPPVIF
jgi:hypothetical protein